VPSAEVGGLSRGDIEGADEPVAEKLELDASAKLVTDGTFDQAQPIARGRSCGQRGSSAFAPTEVQRTVVARPDDGDPTAVPWTALGSVDS